MLNYLNLNTKDNKEPIIKEFISEKINVDNIDYYYSNVISRSSKTMTDCRNEKIKLNKTGTEG